MATQMQAELIDYMGTDESIVRAARVSTGTDLEAATPQKQKGLIGYLVKHLHTSPLESCVVTFRVTAPLFVRDQWVRHRTMSYSVKSLRFGKAEPEFYIAPKERPLVNAGSGAHPDLVQSADAATYLTYHSVTKDAYTASWDAYKALLDAGVAEELARAVLPSGLFTSFYVTANLWNWLQFLDKRVESKSNKPQWEIEYLALQIKDHLTNLFPYTMEAWND